jgi:YegS/Rv2252/BmrU family lipid kinase
MQSVVESQKSIPFVIVNPRSAGGKTARRWPKLLEQLRQTIGPVHSTATAAPGHATQLVREALSLGHEWIIVVGGDGTLNEAVNGMLVDDRPVVPDACLSVIMNGTGNDFRRSLGTSRSPEEDIATLAAAPVRAIDVGKLTFVDHAGNTQVRYFDNIASFGMSGLVDRYASENVRGKELFGAAAFLWAIIKALAVYRNTPVQMAIDDGPVETVPVRLAQVCNGQFAAGGMWFAPEARLDDGQFDIVTVHNAGVGFVLANFPKIFSGKHLPNPKISLVRGRKLVATSDREVLLDVDGEACGRLPATFEILPCLLRIKG